MTVPVPTTPPPTEPRRGLGAGWITFIVIDVLLVLALAVLAVQVLTGDDATPGATSAASATATGERTGAAQDPTGEESPTAAADGEPVTFAAPSRNITCTIDASGARCGIAELAAAPAPVDGCDGTIGYVYAITAAGVQVPCVPAEEQPGPAPEDVTSLEYGESVSGFGFTCESAEDGVSCLDEDTGSGFRLARAGGTPF